MWSSFQGRKCLVDIYGDIPCSLCKLFRAFEDFSKLYNEGLSMAISKVKRRGLKDHAFNPDYAFCCIVENLDSPTSTVNVPGWVKRIYGGITGLSEFMGSA